MAKVGRPPKFRDHDLAELVEKFRRYIDETEIPIVAEFAYQNDLNRAFLYDREEFSALLQKCVAKKEVNVERGTMTGQIVPAMGIFSLKQLGWKDRAEKIVFVDPKTLTEAELRKLMEDGS